MIDNWNIQTNVWLRRLVYDRVYKGRTLCVFVLSAAWHGFYPGYYVAFLLFALLTYAGRGVQFFQNSTVSSKNAILHFVS